MAVPATLDLYIVRGDTESIVVTMYSDDAQTTAVNVTGRTYTSQLRTSQDSVTISATLTCTVTNGAGGEVTCVLPASQSQDLSPGQYYWDLQENASGTISTILSGIAYVSADVTRS